MNFKAKIKDEEFILQNKVQNWTLDGKEYNVSTLNQSNVVSVEDTDGNKQEAIIQEIDLARKKVKLLLAQKELTIEISDFMDEKMFSLGIDIKKLQKAKNIKAPMPGLILKTLVKEGQEVKPGEALFILEAMKMENVFKAPDELTINKILINEGDTVDKNQELITFS